MRNLFKNLREGKILKLVKKYDHWVIRRFMSGMLSDTFIIDKYFNVPKSVDTIYISIVKYHPQGVKIDAEFLEQCKRWNQCRRYFDEWRNGRSGYLVVRY